MRGSSPLTRGKRAPPRTHDGRQRLIPAHAGKTCPPGFGGKQGRAHPRSRGENRIASTKSSIATGSSPLTRGKRQERTHNDSHARLIPAHAGKTCGWSLRFAFLRAHPRSRGENALSARWLALRTGSSPLTRGKLIPGVSNFLGGGLIPAHAGKTRCPAPPCRSHRAHPRSRGENAQVYNDMLPGGGSSPLTRGKLDDGFVGGGFEGLIPAHAGKTPRRGCTTVTLTAHPRSRGENRHPGHGLAGQHGSSPLTRGKLHEAGPCVGDGGLIPAHAGKTSLKSWTTLRAPAHPRSRGENTHGGSQFSAITGSSPLTRGKPGRRRSPSGPPGLIPAHAGKTRGGRIWWRRNRAHPRSRGENREVANGYRMVRGSSPLTRGKHGGGRGLSRAVGLIPAHAGKTLPGVGQGAARGAHPRSRGENRRTASLMLPP